MPDQPSEESLKAAYRRESAQRVREHLLKYLLARNPDLDKEKLGEAILFSIDAHRNQFRKSGMPYAEHPVEVAKLLAEFRVDTPTIIAGLLHDVVEDTEISLETIQNHFGAEVAFMVDAVTKISAIQQKSRQESKAETYRKLLLSMARDARVILIKFADRIHNMRTLSYVPNHKKKRIARETMDIYAPLAHRFGMNRIRSELEDLSFRYLNPTRYQALLEKFQNSREEREIYIQKVVLQIQAKFREVELEIKVSGRPKHVYSIAQKMTDRHCEFEDLFDLFAVRLVVSSREECYVAIGHLHALWTPLQSRFKDYIAVPKPNLYQSLHTAVIGPEGRIVEVQIRTPEMDDVAERGFAAHWQYKSKRQEITWLQEMIQTQDDIEDSNEFLEFFRVDLKPQELLIFTPKGKTFSLPHGASVLDFAFHVHTKVGETCIGAMVQNNFMNPEDSLPYGATVSILKSPNQQPSLEWLTFVHTHKAQAAIRRSVRQQKKVQGRALGKEILQRELRLRNMSTKPPEFDFFKNKYRVKSWNELYERMGSGELPPHRLGRFLEELSGTTENKARNLNPFRRKKAQQHAVVVGGNSELLLEYAQCCSPIPGDRICGLLTRGEGVQVHRMDCGSLKTLSPESQGILPLEWEEGETMVFEAGIEVLGSDRERLLEDITVIFSDQGVEIIRATVVTLGRKVRDRFRIRISNLKKLESTISLLKSLPGVDKVART